MELPIRKPLVIQLPLFITLFLDGISLSIVFPLLSALIVNPTTSIVRHVIINRESIYSLIIFTYMFSWFWGATFISAMSDYVGRKLALCIAMAGKAFGFIITALGLIFGNLIIFTLGRVIEGMTNAAQPAAQAIMMDVCPNQKLRATYIAYILLPVALGDLLGIFIYHLLPQIAFFQLGHNVKALLLGASISVFNFFLVVFGLRETFVSKFVGEIGINVFYPIELIHFAFSDSRIRKLTWLFFAAIAAWSSYYMFVGSYAIHYYNYTPIEVSWLTVVPVFGFILGWGLCVKWLNKRFHSASVITGCLVLSAVFVILTVMIINARLFLILIAPISMLSCIVYATLIAVYSSFVPPEKQGWVMAITTAVHFAGIILPMFIFPYIAAYSIQVPFYFSIGLFITCLILVASMKRDTLDFTNEKILL